jgi:hypothetical protein
VNDLDTRAAEPQETTPGESRPRGPSLGKRLKIRSMVTVAGEVLPFFWPMRNFISHNPLHGLEDRPFEQAVAEATRLFHARGYLRRAEYRRLMARGSIAPDVLEGVVNAFVEDWLAEHDDAADDDLRRLLRRCLMTIFTHMDQPAPGVDVPCTEEVLKAMKPGPERPERGSSGP